MLRTLMPRKARYTVHSETERASGAIKRLLAFLNRISMRRWTGTDHRGRSWERTIRSVTSEPQAPDGIRKVPAVNLGAERVRMQIIKEVFRQMGH